MVLPKLPVDDEEDEKYETAPVEFEKVTVSTTSHADPPQPSSTTLSDPIKLASPLLDDRQPSQQPDHQEHSPSPPSPESHEETKKSSTSHEIQKEAVRPSDSPLASSVRIRSYSSTSQATRPSQDSPKIVNRHSSIPLLKPAMRDSPLMTSSDRFTRPPNYFINYIFSALLHHLLRLPSSCCSHQTFSLHTRYCTTAISTALS